MVGISPVKTLASTFAVLLLGAMFTTSAAEPLRLATNDVVAFVGGGDVSAAQHTGHLESLLARQFPGARFRNFAWEGDTVFARPRDFNFPPLTNHLREAGITVLFVQFGRMEAFAHPNELKTFPSAYESLLTNLLATVRKVVLVTSVPFEKPADPLPDVSARNEQLEIISNHIRAIATRHQLPVVDLFSDLRRAPERLTEDGVQLTPRGHALVAQSFVKQLGLKPPSLSQDETWADPHLEKLRQLIIAKNRLWFHYWRPQNWAFLGGDRTEQPSSRDHRDPKIRWFPKEMEKFTALISEKEEQISRLTEEDQK